MEKLFWRMKVLINLVAFYLRWFHKYELVGPWHHDLDNKEKLRAPKPAASTSNLSSSSSSSSTSSSSAPPKQQYCCFGVAMRLLHHMVRINTM